MDDLSISDSSAAPSPSTPTPASSPATSKGCNTLTCPKGGWCFPTILYLVLGILMIIGHLFSKGTVGNKVAFAIFTFLWVIGFTFLIWYFCRQGKIGWAWIILILALIIQAVFLSLSIVIVI